MSVIYCDEGDHLVDTDEYPEFHYDEKTQTYTCDQCTPEEETDYVC